MNLNPEAEPRKTLPKATPVPSDADGRGIRTHGDTVTLKKGQKRIKLQELQTQCQSPPNNPDVRNSNSNSSKMSNPHTSTVTPRLAVALTNSQGQHHHNNRNSHRPSASPREQLSEFKTYIKKLKHHLFQTPKDYNGKILKYICSVRRHCRCNKSRAEVILREEGMIGEFIRILKDVDSSVPENVELIVVVLTILGNCFAMDYGSRDEQKRHGFLQTLKNILSIKPNKEIIYRALKALGNLLYQKDCSADALKFKLILTIIHILDSTPVEDKTNENLLISGIRVLRIYGSGNDEKLKHQANMDGCTVFLSNILGQISTDTTGPDLIIEILKALSLYSLKPNEFCRLSRSKMSLTDNNTIKSIVKLLQSNSPESKIYMLTLELAKNLIGIETIAWIFKEQNFYPIFFTQLSKITTYTADKDLKLIALHLKLLQSINSSFQLGLLPSNQFHGTEVGIETTFRFIHEPKFENFHSFLWTLYSKLPQWHLKKLCEDYELVTHIEQSFEASYGIVRNLEEVCERTCSLFRNSCQQFFCEKHEKWVNWDVNTCIPEPESAEEDVEIAAQELPFSPPVNSFPSPVYSVSSGSGWSPGSMEGEDSDSGGYSPMASPLPANVVEDGEVYSDSEDPSSSYKISRWTSAAKELPRISPNDTQTLDKVQNHLKINILTGILETIRSIYYLQFSEIKALTPSIFSLLLDVTVVRALWRGCAGSLQKLHNVILTICKSYLEKNFDSKIAPILLRCYLMCGNLDAMRDHLRQISLNHQIRMPEFTESRRVLQAFLNLNRSDFSMRSHLNGLLKILTDWKDDKLKLKEERLEELLAAICSLAQSRVNLDLNNDIPIEFDDLSVNCSPEEMITVCLDDNSKLVTRKSKLLFLSPVFESMFSGNFSESSQQSVTLRNVSSAAAKFLFSSDPGNSSSYSEQLDLNLCIELLTISQQYMISSVYRRVCNCIVTHHLCHYNALWIYAECTSRFSQMDQLEGITSNSLRLKSLSFLLKNPRIPFAVKSLLHLFSSLGLSVVLNDLKSLKL